MKNYRAAEMITAYKEGGYRERFAMDNGNKTTLYMNGHKIFKFTYSRNIAYQDANGAMYDAKEKRWID